MTFTDPYRTIIVEPATVPIPDSEPAEQPAEEPTPETPTPVPDPAEPAKAEVHR